MHILCPQGINASLWEKKKKKEWEVWKRKKEKSFVLLIDSFSEKHSWQSSKRVFPVTQVKYFFSISSFFWMNMLRACSICAKNSLSASFISALFFFFILFLFYYKLSNIIILIFRVSFTLGHCLTSFGFCSKKFSAIWSKEKRKKESILD